MSLYSLYVPAGASGSSKVFFDVWNVAGSGVNLELLSARPVGSGAVAVTGTLAVDLFLTRTSAVGTGGTAATYEGTSLTAMTISSHHSAPLVSGLVSGRLTPSAGATTAAVLAWTSVYTEETFAGTYTPSVDLVDSRYGGIMVKPGSGFKVVQGSVASVGNTGFNVLFRLV